MNQLFRKKPPLELINKILGFVGIINFNENYKFTREDLKNKDVVQKVLDEGMEEYYIKCKYDKYFIDLNEKKLITIFRQLLRIYGYKIVSIEKFSNGNKYLVYHLMKNHNDQIILPGEKIILSFD